MSDRRLRARAALGEYFGIAVVGALVIALAGGYLAYGAYAQEHTRTETRTVSSWESAGTFDHQATVVNGSGPFEMGRVLENRSVYFRSITPRLNGTFAYSYTASGGGNLTADGEVVLVIRSVSEGEQGEASTEYWRVEETVSNGTAALGPGETLALSFSKNVTAAEGRAESIEEDLGSTPGTTEVFLEARVDLTGTRNGAPVDRVRTYRMPITYESGVYRVADPGRVTASDTVRERVTVAAQAGTLGRYGGPALLVAGLLVAAGLVVADRRDALELSAAEREYLAYRTHRSEFEEWIHAVRLPPEAFERPEAEAASLGDLVDLAIDADAAVHEDPDSEAYYVVGDGMLYSYRPPEPDEEDLDPAQRTLPEVLATDDGETAPSAGGNGDGTDDGGEDDADSDGDDADVPLASDSEGESG